MQEIWKDIKDYEGLYQVSNLGRVKSLNYNRTGKERILKPGKTHDEYLQVNLCKNGKGKSLYVHKLVCEAFIPNPDNKPQVNHLDGNKLDNSVENLEWCTPAENIQHAIFLGIRIVPKGKNNPLSKLVYCITNGKVYHGTEEAGRELGLHSGGVSLCCRGKYKQTGGYKFKFVEEDK